MYRRLDLVSSTKFQQGKDTGIISPLFEACLWQSCPWCAFKTRLHCVSRVIPCNGLTPGIAVSVTFDLVYALSLCNTCSYCFIAYCCFSHVRYEPCKGRTCVVFVFLSSQRLAWFLTYARLIRNVYCSLNNDCYTFLTWDRDCVKKIIFYSEIKFIIEVMRVRWRRKRNCWEMPSTLSCYPVTESLYYIGICLCSFGNVLARRCRIY